MKVVVVLVVLVVVVMAVVVLWCVYIYMLIDTFNTSTKYYKIDLNR